MRSELDGAGAVWADYHGRELVRHYGDPAGEYAAATGTVALFDRSHRTRLSVKGRSPAKMLSGVLAGVMPAAPTRGSDGLWRGRSTYHAVLTPKGKMISDLWAALLGPEETAGFLLDVPVAGAEGLRAALGKLLPPRFAAVSDVSADTGHITAVGPGAAAVVSRLGLGLRVDTTELSSLAEGEWRTVDDPWSSVRIERTEEVWPAAYSLIGPRVDVTALWRTLIAAGARPSGNAVWSTLRVEAGRPVFGTDMDEDTIPTEAGIEGRAIDHTKGCYTGQEVIVRIRDRGHVNRLLQMLQLGDVPTPAAGTELRAADGSGKPVGRITSAVQSPKYGGVVALAYVGRGVDRLLLDGREIRISVDG